MPEDQYLVLKEWYHFLLKHFPQLKPDSIIYLRSTPEIVYERMQRRMRIEEKSVTIEYLKEIHQFYESWLNSNNSQTVLDCGNKVFNCPIVILNADNSAEKVVNDFESNSENIF